MPENLIYSFEPVYDENSKILLLGTMPSPASIAAGIYYAHPQNAFWRILNTLFSDSSGSTLSDKKAFLLRNNVALWDTLKYCSRPSALDSNIKEAFPNDISGLLKDSPQIKAVFLNGGAALRFYKKYHESSVNLSFFGLPSTSPANATMNFEKKLEAWKVILNYI